jgi:hypothetical protein
LTVTTQDKSTVEISQNFVAFSEHMNFTIPWIINDLPCQFCNSSRPVADRYWKFHQTSIRG